MAHARLHRFDEVVDGVAEIVKSIKLGGGMESGTQMGPLVSDEQLRRVTGLVTPAAVESGRGPQRTLYTVTPQGRRAAAHWLDTPVEHVRDVRSHLLLKLALLDRAGRDPADLLRRQRAILEPIAEAVKEERPQRKGFDATLLAWRRATAAATLDFIDDIIRPGPGD